MKWVIGVICILGFCLCGAMWALGDGGVTAAPGPEPATNSVGHSTVECGGIASEGKRVVYVVNHSGEMLDTLDGLSDVLKASVNALAKDRSFAVVTFSERVDVRPPTMMPQLVGADDVQKASATTWINRLRPEWFNGDEPPAYRGALDTAFALKPDVIFFLTGDEAIDPKFYAEITALNKNHSVKINALVFALAPPKYSEQFQKLVGDNGGQYKSVLVRKPVVPTAGEHAASSRPTIAQIAGMQVAGTQVAATQIAVDAQIAIAKFYGVEVKANRIVYVIDHSGSTLDNFDFLREEIKRSVSRLSPVQQFAVVTFADDVDADSPTALARATAENKRALVRRIDYVRSQGQNDDMLPPFQQAFKRAFALKPQVIFFLTDGLFDPKLLDVVQEMNKDHKVQIDTFAFVQEDADYKVQMQSMAKDNGGEYKFVAEKDLGR